MIFTVLYLIGTIATLVALGAIIKLILERLEIKNAEHDTDHPAGGRYY